MLFDAYRLGSLDLKNRAVMAPMTRSRATSAHVPTALMAEYYGQRASAGLIVTEGIAPSADGAGYSRIPGLWSAEQVEAWKPVTAALHARGGRVFAQLMHTGRVAHPLNQPEGARIVAPSALAAPGQMFTDQEGPKPHPVPQEMTAADIARARDEVVTAARNAVAAGFDGVELHAANGYLLEQFLNPASNQRSDAYGADRSLFVRELTAAVASVIGEERVGIRLSPYGTNGGLGAFDGIDEFYLRLVRELPAVYVHLIDQNGAGAPGLANLSRKLREGWPRSFIASGGYDAQSAERALEEGRADLVAFGRAFIANPDLPERMQRGLPLAQPDRATFFSPGPRGYVDYPRAG